MNMTKRMILLFVFAFAMMARADELSGFLFGEKYAPDGTEWQNPELLSLNKELPRAYMFPFADKEQAKQVLPEGSSYYQSLDGTWKFHWVSSPEKRPVYFYMPIYDVSAWDDIKVPGCWNVQGLQKDGTMKYGVPIYVNQPVIFYHEVKVDDWREGVMRQPKDSRYTTYQYPNEVGSYRRTFLIPKEWKDREIFINFDGVDSFFYLWVNGKFVGFSKNSRNTARFNITPYLNKSGENVLAVEVYRSSDGSFLEAQDMFRLPGIFRSTYLTAMPKVQIRDMAVRTVKIEGDEATISIDRETSNFTDKVQGDVKIEYSIYPVKLYTDECLEQVRWTEGGGVELQKRETVKTHTELVIPHPQLWSAEAPYRYVLVAELKDKKGKVLDCTSTYFGIRTVEIKDTPSSEDEFGLAGRYFYVNGKPVKLKGVNRHETNPSTGHAITHEQMLEEVMLMKRGNINHVRLSHYSNDPYWYYLADKYGLYLEDECNIESHEYYYGKESLSHPKEWRAAHVARNMEMVHSHVNYPSIVIWSLGNEAGPGENFKASYDAIKAFDTSRPVQYERNNDIVDMGSNQYPSVAWVQQVAKGKSNVKYPYHISEYAHSMGNSLGNLVDYWEAMESSNFFCGAAIWDWVDQAIDTYTKDGKKYMGYGGDHGDWPNDGMFCMNGIMLPDLSPKPQYYEVKKVYQNVGVTLNEVKERNGKDIADFTIFNKNYFEPISSREYDIVAYTVLDGEKMGDVTISLHEDIQPRKSVRCYCPVNEYVVGEGEYFLNVEFRLKEDKPWAKKGYVQMAEQLFVQEKRLEGSNWQRGALQLSEDGEKIVVSGKDFNVTFDNTTGSLCGMQYGGKTILKDSPLQLSAFRAPVDNDNWARDQWFQQGLYDLQHKTVGKPNIEKIPEGPVYITYTVVSQAKGRGGAKHRPGKAGQPYESVAEATGEGEHVSFTTRLTYNVYPDGTVVLASSIITSNPDLALPRLGYEVRLPSQFSQYTYYGRGPLNNYNDRKTGSFVGFYESTVQDQFVNFPKPQSMGNREDVRWCALRDSKGNGLLFLSELGTMSTSALPWSALQMMLAQHPHELPESDGTYLHLDCKVNGLGGNSCGQGGPLKQDRVLGTLHQMKIMIRHIDEDYEMKGTVIAKRSILCPVAIYRDKAGKVTIAGDPEYGLDKFPVSYRIDKGKTMKYTEPFNFQQGGTIYAWYEGDEKNPVSATFERIEKIPLDVVYVSSEEGPDGGYAKNLVDNDPSTIWHTMYSITVPKYPHWIDFDCNEVKTLKGFTYLPRQDGSPNGNIKGYKVQVSQDGKVWGDTVCEGDFENNAKEKKVLFQKPIKARYLRFTALSSQNGADFASGAEFGVLAE
ncbi:MAG: discoidin domain-containing protein [Bacteroidaceae bacterium]|nr:discoidin domain-containing protein [Bacteroidaceae bacterium]